MEQFTRGAGGQFVYTGRYFTFTAEGWSWSRMMGVRWLLTGAMALLGLAGGCLPVPALYNAWYVILPYALTVCGVVSLVWAAARMAWWGNPLREYVHHATVRQISPRTIFTALLSLCTVGGQVVFCFINPLQGIEILFTILFLCFHVGISALSLALKRLETCWTWTEESN